MPGGQQISVGQGSLVGGGDRTAALSGSQSTLGQGSLVVGGDRSVSLSGQQSTTGQGSVLWHPDEADALHGQNIFSGQGSLAFRSQHGQQITSAQGSVQATNPQPALTGFQITTGQGTVTAGGDSVTVHITGEEISSLSGTVVIGPVLLTGIQADFATGSVGRTNTLPLVGSVSTVGQGAIVPGIDADDAVILTAHGSTAVTIAAALTGSAVTTHAGTLGTNDKQEALTGSAVTSAAGTLVPVQLRALTGSSVTTEQGAFGAPGITTLSGQVITTQQGTLTGPIPLTGIAITTSAGTMIPGRDVTVLIVGAEVTVSHGHVVALITEWADQQDPTAIWTKQVDPSSIWTKQTDPSTSWTKQ